MKQPEWFTEVSWPHHLRLCDVGRVFGVGNSTVFHWWSNKDCPRHCDGSFDVLLVEQWLKSRGIDTPKNELELLRDFA